MAYPPTKPNGGNAVSSTTEHTGKGGTRIERQKADSIFEQYVCEKSGNARLAETVHNAVRFFGSPINPARYRLDTDGPTGESTNP